MHRFVRDAVVAAAVLVLVGAGVWAGSAKANGYPVTVAMDVSSPTSSTLRAQWVTDPRLSSVDYTVGWRDQNSAATWTSGHGIKSPYTMTNLVSGHRYVVFTQAYGWETRGAPLGMTGGYREVIAQVLGMSLVSASVTRTLPPPDVTASTSAARQPSPVPWIGVASAWSCDRTGLVIFDQEDVGAPEPSSGIKAWNVHPDKGNAYVQVHDISGRVQPGGLWVTVPITRRGEGLLGWSHDAANVRGIHWDKVRVVRTDTRVASYPAIEQPGCPPV